MNKKKHTPEKETSKQWATGNLEFFAEQGHSGAWAIQVDGYWHGPDFDCGSPTCPLNYREVEGEAGVMSLTGTGRRMAEQHYAYEGLYVLARRDRLQRLDKQGKPKGRRLTLRRLPRRKSKTWQAWFYDGQRARVRSRRGDLPVPVKDLMRVFPDGHYA